MPEMLSLNGLLDKVRSYSQGKGLDILEDAYHFSREAHCSQKRSEGSPYIKHPLSVAYILADIKMDVSSIVAGLLHDTIEDTGTTIDNIRVLFGKEIAFIVESLTKLSKVEFKTQKEAQAENFRKMLLAMSEDVRVILIKFADRLHNMRTLQHLPENKRQRIAAETLEIYAPLANRLGIGWLRTEFEDLSFKFLMPDLYEELVRKVARRKEEQEGYIKELSELIMGKLQEEGLPGKVTGRVKHHYGIYQKMQKQRITFDQVHDVLGLRILTDTKANCYAILGLIHSLWTPIPGKFKDYIGVPKSNMYQSLHTTVIGPKGERVEFQIRTEEMHRIAEEGIASHWKYKEKGALDEKSSKYISWLRDLVQVQKDVPDAMDFLEAVKGEVVPEVVYIFTPKGEIKEMPIGSTPVDFAYSVHTQVGHRCVGAKINGKIVPLRHKLKNGDTIEIITSQTHGPSRDWLKFVVTQRAKTRIKQWIKAEERHQSVELGIKLLEGELRKHNMSNALMKSDEILKVGKALGMTSLEDLFVSVGFGKVSPHQVVNRLLPEKAVEEPEPLRPRRTVKEHKGVSIKGIDDVLYHTAKCCYPVPGDNLVGFVTIGKGVTVHRRDCANLERLVVEDARLVGVEWQPIGDATANARLFVETIDKPGILANLSALISSVNININHLEVTTTQDQRGYITFIIGVRDLLQLRALIQKISQMEGILRVRR
ncbi:MAG TPA: bifunctional (p)ppGpp synthetase/guanosine-3',5'-bis(diphosphate) 3'-pyrophosphohydrolase [Candidatus Sulfobium mesophilum]|uniref:GTP pyrophosphokinase n=1 Tax=Candidatus Sulfobium mesophilum TaxID=2016548 RepID=A0A2U3QFG4_9BACT|nr:GTP pyrophosphokinase [Candidatus Sulfobium mesophilum]HSB31978.1 bifunctional (p)ppGpp synthetase/guanosine-3',5'-bis(diphosphate) 3'-pyrophosphohydrolase [Candidatus Sulfobium mesophilum]